MGQPRWGRGSMLAKFVRLLLFACCASAQIGTVRAQSTGATGPAADEGPSDAEATSRNDGPDAPGETITAEALQELRDELAAQRETLETQQAQLDAQREELAAQQAQREAAPTSAADELEDVDLDALAEELESGTYERAEPLQFYGFVDMGFQSFIAKESSRIRPFLPSQANSFVLGNINLFLDIRPTQHWRSLIELRFTNLPHGEDIAFGNPLGMAYERVDARVFDTTSPSGSTQVIAGSVIIERAWIEYLYRDWLAIKVGYFFTPFGIWNVDHGSPTLISLTFPTMITLALLPQRQLGLQVSGVIDIARWDLGYHITASNGRTPGQFDLSADKMLGGRIFARRRTDAFELKVGVSGFWGTYLDQEKNITSFEPFVVTIDDTVAYTEGGLGLDVALDVGAFRLRAEGIARRIVYEPGMREPVFGPPGSYAPDRWELNGYILAAYRTPWGLEPYLYFEMNHGPTTVGDTSYIPSIGLNIHFAPEVMLKAQYTRVYFANLVSEEPADPNVNFFSVFSTRVVLSF